MKKTLSVILTLILSVGLIAGCNSQTGKEENNAKVINPLPETLDVNALDNCTVAVSLEKGNAYVDDSGKMVMDVTVYSYELYDMVDISTLEENDVIVRQNKEVKITGLERLDSGLVRINGGEENGGFDLVSNDNTVYYEIGMSDMKNYYELGEVTLPVSDEFEYVDESEPDSKAKHYSVKDFLAKDSGIVLIGVDAGVNGDRIPELEAIGAEMAKNEKKAVIKEVIDRVCADIALQIIDLCAERNLLPPNSSIGFTGRAIISGNKPQYILDGVTKRGLYAEPVNHLVFVDDGLARGSALMGRCMNSSGHPKCPI